MHLTSTRGAQNIILLAVLLLQFSSASAAEQFKDFSELDIEQLLNTTVYSASKYEQKLSQAPNAMYVITQEDIKRSGAVSLPDLFRRVPGVDVANVHGGPLVYQPGVSTLDLHRACLS